MSIFSFAAGLVFGYGASKLVYSVYLYAVEKKKGSESPVGHGTDMLIGATLTLVSLAVIWFILAS